MRSSWIVLVVALLLQGCSSWGDYSFKSDRFKFKITFPERWEIWDRSDDRNDYLVASLPDDIRDASITVRATPTAPDIGTDEVYPSFLEGDGDAAILPKFEVLERGSISCKNREGRQIIYTYVAEKHRMKGIRTLFIGLRYILRVGMEMPEDNFDDYVLDFRKMISLMEM
ncbi:MAG TPA: hypothetical protein ENL08_01685 [Bacteroidetes bacterium]|nr:hypothetical protein [Bacteroidota bacterium]